MTSGNAITQCCLMDNIDMSHRNADALEGMFGSSSHAHNKFLITPTWRFCQRRNLRLAPPFLLDDYTPRYQLLSSVDAAKKRSSAYAHLRNCNLCPRLCGVNRYERTGYCLIGEKVKVSVIAPHFGEGGFLLPSCHDVPHVWSKEETAGWLTHAM